MPTAAAANLYIDDVIARTEEGNPAEPEFLQAVREVLESLAPVVDRHDEFRRLGVLERMVEPERMLSFRVSWLGDDGSVEVTRGYRVQFSSAIGPYKGGLRFHPTVTPSVLKFLGFEQVFKNSLTGLWIGGGKGGAVFDPKGRSDAEVMRFCQAYMSELCRHIGPDTDVPAGDIGVGSREIGFLVGQYRRLANRWGDVLTGKPVDSGGSLLRPEATGYGLVYFTLEMAEASGKRLQGKRCLVSGSGNVAQYAVEKLIEVGAVPVTLSDSSGFIHDPDGITREKLAWVKALKNERRGRISEYADEFPSASYTPADPDAPCNPLWEVEAACAFPCATQNEINGADAAHLAEGGVEMVAEGANMPSTPEAIERFQEAGIVFGPAKAANAGGVAVSALEMAQNASRMAWTREEVDARLQAIMRGVHHRCREAAIEYAGSTDYAAGANIAGFLRIARAMVQQGVV